MSHSLLYRLLPTTLILLGSLLPAQGQDFKETVSRMNQALAQSNQFRILIQISIYDQASAARPASRQQAEVYRAQDNFFYRLGDSEMLINDRHFVMVNTATREIVRRPRNPEDEKSLRAQAGLQPDNLQRVYGTPAYVGNPNGLLHYRFLPKRGDISKIDLYFSEPDKLPKKIRYHYKGGQLVQVDYTTFDLHPAIPENLFDERRYFTVEKGKYKATGAYSRYSVQ